MDEQIQEKSTRKKKGERKKRHVGNTYIISSINLMEFNTTIASFANVGVILQKINRANKKSTDLFFKILKILNRN